jgi:pilus assembly protein Flp/PilA
MRRVQLDMKRLMARFARSEEGPTATEYAIMLALIVVVSISVVMSIGNRISGLYVIIEDAMPQGFLS